MLFETYEDGVVFASSSNNFSKIKYSFDQDKLIYYNFQVKSLAVGGNHALKFNKNGLYSLNENGLHYYSKSDNKTYTQSLFSITNCGLTMNESGELIAVADFGGTLHIFNTEKISHLPAPEFSIFVGAPIRSIAWCSSTNKIAIGCVGGSLFEWPYGSPSATLIDQI